MAAWSRFRGATRWSTSAACDWVGAREPAADDLAGGRLIDQGFVHVKTVRETGGAILGHRDLALDGISGLRELTHAIGGTVFVFEGGRRIGPATRQDLRTLPLQSTWGYRHIQELAEIQLVEGVQLTRPPGAADRY